MSLPRQSHPPRRLAGALLLPELGAAAWLCWIIVRNVAGGIDESYGVALALLMVLGLPRLYREPRRTKARIATISLILSLWTAEFAFSRYVAAHSEIFATSEELGLQGSLAWVDNPRLVYVYKPGSGGGQRVNSDGLLEDELPIPKPPGTFRIGVLGDSTSVMLEDYRRLWHQVLERSLNAAPPGPFRYEVVNAAVTGYNALQEAEMLRAILLRYQPDAIIVGYCLNDPFALQMAYPASHLKLARMARLLWGMARWRLGRSAAVPLATRVTASTEAAPRLPFGSWSRFYREEDAQWRHVVVEGYEAMAQVCRARGIPLVAFITPDVTGDPDIEPVYRQIEALWDRERIAWIDVHSRLGIEERLALRVRPNDPYHANAAFHERVAGELESALRAKGLLLKPAGD